MTAAERKGGMEEREEDNNEGLPRSISQMLEGGLRVPLRIGAKFVSRMVTVVDV
jgi:hypothetical protein